jgi:hypothetical protein
MVVNRGGAKETLVRGDGEKSAPEPERLKFLVALVQSSHALLEACADNEEARKNVRIRLGGVLREAIIFLWEVPKQAKHSPGRCSVAAARTLANADRAQKAKLLRFDHSIPLKMVIDKLLLAHDSPRAIKRVLDRVEARLLTVDEDKKLNRLYRNTLPEGWDWKTGAAGARHEAAGIKFPDETGKLSNLRKP